MENVLPLLVIGSAFFVYYDATKHKIGHIPNEKGFFNISAGAWSIATLFLWIVAFPAYLIKRRKLIEKARENPQLPSNLFIKWQKKGCLQPPFFRLILCYSRSG